MTPKIDANEHPQYRTINVGGAVGGYRPMFFEVIIYSDETTATEALASADLAPERSTVKRTIECRLLIDPFKAKSIYKWLERNIVEYEKIFGRIPSPEELQAKAGKSDLQ